MRIPRGGRGLSVAQQPANDWQAEPATGTEARVGVPRRSAIQFHSGQDVGWSEGCFIVGTASDPSGRFTKDAYYGVVDSDKAIDRLRRTVDAAGRDVSDIRIAVGDDGGLFPDLRGASIC